MSTCMMILVSTCPVDLVSKHLLSISSNGNVLVLLFVYNSKITFWFYIQRKNLRHEFKSGVLIQPVGVCSILAVEGICHCLLLQRQWKTAITGIVTVNNYYLLLGTPGSVTSSKRSQRSLTAMFLNKVFSPELLYNQSHNLSHSTHMLESYTVTVLGWQWQLSAEGNPRWTVKQISSLTESSVRLQTSKTFPLPLPLNPVETRQSWTNPVW